DAADRQMSAWGATELGMMYRRTTAEDEAIVSLQKAIELYEGIPDLMGAAWASGELAGCYVQQGRLDYAFEVFDKNKALLRRINGRGHQVTADRLATAPSWLVVAEQSSGVDRAAKLKFARRACATAIRQSKH